MSKILVIAEHLDGKLNSSTARCVSAAHAVKPAAIDVLVLAADAAAIAALSRWVRRSGMTALRMVNAPRQLVALIGRYGLDTTLPAAVAPPHRNLLAA